MYSHNPVWEYKQAGVNAGDISPHGSILGGQQEKKILEEINIIHELIFAVTVSSATLYLYSNLSSFTF